MSAAPLVQSKTPAYFPRPSLDPAGREAIQELVHELRQPLSSIEAIAYYMEMTLPPELLEARQYMLHLQELVAQAESMLASAASAIRKPPTSTAAAGAS